MKRMRLKIKNAIIEIVTGELLTQIAKEQAAELRKIFDKYCELTKK